MRDHKRLLALLLCAGFLALLAVSSAFVVLESGHACCGKACGICDWVAKAGALLRGMACFAFLSMLAAVLLPVLKARCALKASRHPALNTPVCWKVRLNN